MATGDDGATHGLPGFWCAMHVDHIVSGWVSIPTEDPTCDEASLIHVNMYIELSGMGS